MIITKKSLPRRTFLRGLGTTLALPLLDSMIPALAGAAALSARIRWPAGAQTGTGDERMRPGWTSFPERFAATANLFVRREVVDDLGGFDASLRSGGDYEFGRRATGAGYRLVYAPEASVVHRPRASLRETWRLHRRLGAGWAALARKGARPALRNDAALRISLGSVIDRAAASHDAMRRREIAHVHAVAMAARWTGRLTGRG